MTYKYNVGVFLMYFLGKESEKNTRITLSCLVFDLYKNFIFMHKNCCPKQKISEKGKLNIFDENKWFQLIPGPQIHQKRSKVCQQTTVS